MNKDIIYIDVEDDITAIIGKVKAAKEKIVALVPPKRVGVLQSAVNLRLLARAAEQGNRRMVLITNNTSLTALAAAAKIPVAKNLQSKPEIPEIAALDIDNGEDIIDGSQLPIGELARTAGGAAGLPKSDDTPKATPPVPGKPPVKPRIKGGVPNFNTFRKKLIFGIGGGIVLMAFLVWAIFFAPRATIIVTARTTDSSANAKVTLDPSLATSAEKASLKSVAQQIKKDASVEFDATGTKDVGEKSKGQVVFKNCETMTTVNVPAGTAITANGRNYVTEEAASVPGGSGGFGGCASPGTSGAIGIVASDIGENYNTPNGTTFTVAGHSVPTSSVYFRATASTNITGGSKRQIKIVTADDVQKAADQLAQQNSDDVKKQLTDKFDNTYTVIDQTFKIDRSNPTSTPAVDQEVASGARPKVSASVTYTLSAITKADLSRYLGDHFKKQLEGSKDQRVYDDGANKATFTNVAPATTGFTANLTATAKIGPAIDDATVKDSAKGKRYGDIQSSLETIQGVDNVDVKFWPFWVSAAPDDTKRITITFNLNESK